ncbi:NAD(P)-dependent oxidoreductase [Escherichia coli]
MVAATDRREVNALVYQSRQYGGIFANVVDDPKRSSFIMPSIIDRSPLMVAISSVARRRCWPACCGKNSRPCCRNIWGPWRPSPGSLRDRVKARFASMGERRRFWERLLGADRLG